MGTLLHCWWEGTVGSAAVEISLTGPEKLEYRITI